MIHIAAAGSRNHAEDAGVQFSVGQRILRNENSKTSLKIEYFGTDHTI